MDFLDTTTIGQALAIQNNVGLSGLAKYLAVDALAISGEVKLDVGSLPVYVDGDVEPTLDEWIGDGRLLSSVWGSTATAPCIIHRIFVQGPMIGDRSFWGSLLYRPYSN